MLDLCKRNCDLQLSKCVDKHKRILNFCKFSGATSTLQILRKYLWPSWPPKLLKTSSSCFWKCLEILKVFYGPLYRNFLMGGQFDPSKAIIGRFLGKVGFEWDSEPKNITCTCLISIHCAEIYWIIYHEFPCNHCLKPKRIQQFISKIALYKPKLRR